MEFIGAFVAFGMVFLLLNVLGQILYKKNEKLQCKRDYDKAIKEAEEKDINPSDMIFVNDPRVVKMYDSSDYYYKNSLQFAFKSEGKFGYATFNEFKIMFDKSNLINKFVLGTDRKSNQLYLYSEKSKCYTSADMFTYQGEIKFNNVHMVFEDKKDWDLAQKYVIYKDLERHGLSNFDWAKETGIEKKEVVMSAPVSIVTSYGNWDKLLPIIKEKLATINNQYLLYSTFSKHANLTLVKLSKERLDSIITRLNSNNATKESCDALFNVIKSIESALDEIKNDATGKLITELNIEQKTVEKVMEMNA